MLATGAQSRLFTGFVSGSGKATAVVVCAVMLLAGCGGTGGSAAESSAPGIRGNAAMSDTSDPGDSGVTRLFDPEVIEGVLRDYYSKGRGKVLAEEDAVDDSVVIFEESDEQIIVMDEQIIVMGAKFEVYEDDAGKYRFRLRAVDGGIVAVGGPYDTMAAAKEACAAAKSAAAIATVVEADS